MTTESIRQIANRHRVERVAFDVASASYDANEDDAAEPALRLALNEAFDRCQASAKALARLSPSTIEERSDQLSVALGAALLADEPASTLLQILHRGMTG